MERNGSRLNTFSSTQKSSGTALLVGVGSSVSRALSRACGVPCLAEVFQAVETKTVANEQDLVRVFSDSEVAARVAVVVDARNTKDCDETLRIAQSLRRDYRLRMPLIFWTTSTPTPGELSDSKVPGSYHLQFPSRLCDLAQTIREAQPVPDEATLRDIVLRYCRFDEYCHILIHDLYNAIGQRNELQVRELSRRLTALLEYSDNEAAREALVKAGAFLAAPLAGVIETPAMLASPPAEWRTLLIVDDHGYSEPVIASLKAKGYAPRPVVRTLEEAIEILDGDAPDVLLCDYRLEDDPQKGLRLARRALATEDVSLVVLISAEPIPESELPPGAKVLAGAAKFDAGRIHAVIVEAAQNS